MHQKVDYKNEANPKQKAIEDCKAWLGEEVFNTVENAIIESLKQEEELTDKVMDCICFYLSFTGIKGYPARVFVRECDKKLKKLVAAAKQDIISYNTLPPQIDYRMPWKIKATKAQELIDSLQENTKTKIEGEILAAIEEYYGENGAAYYDSLF